MFLKLERSSALKPARWVSEMVVQRTRNSIGGERGWDEGNWSEWEDEAERNQGAGQTQWHDVANDAQNNVRAKRDEALHGAGSRKSESRRSGMQRDDEAIGAAQQRGCVGAGGESKKGWGEQNTRYC